MNPELMDLSERDREMMGIKPESTEQNNTEKGFRKAYVKLFEKLRTAMLIGSMASSVLNPEVVKAQQGIEQTLTATPETKTESKYVTEEKIWDGVENNETEQAYVSMIVDGVRKFKYYKDLGATGAMFDFGEAENLAESGSDVEVIHSHPKNIYKEINPNADRNINAPLMPSNLDLFSAMQAAEQEKTYGITVYEPSGVWKLSADREHPYVKRYQEMMGGLNAIVQRLKKEINPTDMLNIEKTQTENPDVRTMIDALKRKPETAKIGENFQKEVDEYIAKFPDLTEIQPSPEDLAYETSVKALSGTEPEEITTGIKDYVSAVKKMGIEATYTKRQK